MSRTSAEPPGLAPRRQALAVLETVLIQRQPLDSALADARGLDTLEARDRAMARLMITTVLRRKGEIDALIRQCLDRPLPKNVRPLIGLILGLGAAQLFYMDVPAHAAIATTVDLAASDRRAQVRGFKNLINAVLRRLTREGDAWRQSLDPEKLALPPWLWRRWLAAYGEAETRAMARLALATPPLDLTPRDDAARAWLAAQVPGAAALPQGSMRLDHAGRIEDIPGFTDGLWWVQDAAAALPAQLLAPQAGDQIIDLCAAPGGKTLQLAAAGATVIAVDQSAMRLKRVAGNLARTGLQAQLAAADARAWQPPQPAPKILLDAPCTATGTLRRRPDVARLKTEAYITAMAAVQKQLLAHAARMLAPGGVLVYCVCSLEPEEGEDQIAALLAAMPHITRLPIRPSEAPGLDAALNAAGDLRILPSHWAALGGIDGFFIARLSHSG